MKNSMSNAAIDAAQSARDTLLESSCSSLPGPSATGNQVELQWLTKVLRLLETKDGDGWVVGDVRPTGVRLLAPPFTIGNVPPTLLIHIDALRALLGLGRLEQYKHHFGGNITLFYLDQRFNDGSPVVRSPAEAKKMRTPRWAIEFNNSDPQCLRLCS